MRLKRKLRVRAKIVGSPDRPRLAVFRSNRALLAQLIDDEHGKTLVAKSSSGKNQAQAHELGVALAEEAKTKKITVVVFDRSGYQYHGVIAALARGAREGGLKF